MTFFDLSQFGFYKSFQFVLELLVATLIYVWKLRRQPNFAIRLPLCILACFLFAFLIPTLEVNNAIYTSVIFLLILVFTILMSKIVFKEGWTTLIFCCIAGYTTQHLAYEVFSLTLNCFNINSTAFYGSGSLFFLENPFVLILYLVEYTAVMFFCFFIFGNRIDPKDTADLKFSFIFLFSVFILIVDIVMNALAVYYLAEQRVALLMTGVYNILCCTVALFMQFEVALKRKLETTLEIERHIWNTTKEQYAVSKENIELINLKCHDLKHQIHNLGSGFVIDSAVLKDIEHTIAIYDSVVKTGNEALDVILTEKSLLCNKQGINLSCIVDGEKLNFIKVEDVYALFGNIIDNAIEAVIKLPPERRTINLQVRPKGAFLAILESNYYEDIEVKNGDFRTTKPNRGSHGFGIRSIRHICNEYDGQLTIDAKDNVFTIKILFPIPDMLK